MPNFSVTPACWIESIKPCCRCSMKVRQNKMVRFSRYQLKTMRKIRKEYCLKKKVVISRNYYYYSFKTLPALSKQFSPFSPNAHKIVWKKNKFPYYFLLEMERLYALYINIIYSTLWTPLWSYIHSSTYSA